MLVQAMFERAAYGCKLFCCWCAQDLAANYFWESIGFVPLAFRTGSRRNGAHPHLLAEADPGGDTDRARRRGGSRVRRRAGRSARTGW
jgi:hypothetical protein